MRTGFYLDLDELRKDYPDSDFGYLENEYASTSMSAAEFLHGHCSMFAYELSKTFGYQIEEIINFENDLIHAYCIDNFNGKTAYIDIRGITTDVEEFFEEFSDWVDVTDGSVDEKQFEEGWISVNRFLDAKRYISQYSCLDSISGLNISQNACSFIAENHSSYDITLYQQILSVAADVRNEMVALYGEDLAGKCIEASEKIVEVLSNQFGIQAETVEGWCRFDDECYGSDHPWDPHTWVEIPSLKLYIDVTADQFNYGMYLENEFSKIVVQSGLPYGMQYEEPTWRDYEEICESIDKSKITNSARVSVAWDSFGIAVDMNYSYDKSTGYGESVLCFCEDYAEGAPDEFAWEEAQDLGEFLSEKYNLPLDLLKDEKFLNKSYDNQMQIINKTDIDANSIIYSVSLEPGFLVDVKVCTDTGLVYIMENHDGSCVYSDDGKNSPISNYQFDEMSVVNVVKVTHEKEHLQVKQDLDSIIHSAVNRVSESYPANKIPTKETTFER